MSNKMSELYRSAKDALGSRLRRHETYVTVFSTPQGREVLRHICKAGFVTRSTFVAGDPQQTALNEGSRRLALSILHQVNTNTDKLLEQIEEDINHET